MPLALRAVFPALALSTLLVGCGSSSEKAASSSRSTGDAGPAAVKAGGPCDIHSGFPGDDLCLEPPDPSEGIQLHVGPTSYDDPDALAPYILKVGEEDVKCFNTLVPDGDFYYLRQTNHMRSGSHHMLIPLTPAAGAVEGPIGACTGLGTLGALPGSQTPEHEFPGAEMGPEDAGLARYLPAGAMATFNLHYVNTQGDADVLREAWVNVYRKDASEVTDRLQGIFMVGDLSVNVPANTRQTTHLEFTPALTEKVRVFQLAGHSHAHAESFAAWVTHAGVRTQVYESFNWQEPIELTLNTVVKNPVQNESARRDGGISGLYYLEPGDKLEWECDVNNTTAAPLRFANEAFTAEMCLLAGAYVSDTAGLMRGGCTSAGCGALPGGR
jgi:hypothetical protein